MPPAGAALNGERDGHDDVGELATAALDMQVAGVAARAAGSCLAMAHTAQPLAVRRWPAEQRHLRAHQPAHVWPAGERRPPAFAANGAKFRRGATAGKACANLQRFISTAGAVAGEPIGYVRTARAVL
jgi:hypothetical protein